MFMLGQIPYTDYKVLHYTTNQGLYLCSGFYIADMWNMVEQPILYLNDNKFRNLSAFIVQVDNYNPEVLMPASVFFILPVFLFYLLFHDELKRGFKI